MNEFTAPLITITGPTCSGKTTFVHNLVHTTFTNGIKFVEIISHTTRKPRQGEVEGKHYYYVTEKKFNKMRYRAEFAEYTKFGNIQYGTTKEEVESKFSMGTSQMVIPVVIVEPNGAQQFALYCATREIPYYSVFIDVDQTVAVRRFISRTMAVSFLSNPRMFSDSDVARLKTIYEVEKSWLMANEWNLIVKFYNEANRLSMPMVFGDTIRQLMIAKKEGLSFNINDFYVARKKYAGNKT